MELKDYWLALRHRWRLLVGLVVLGALLGFLSALVLPKTFEASTELFVAPQTGSSTSELVQGSEFVLDRVKSYVEIVNKDVVLQPVIDELDLAMTVEELSDNVVAEVVPDTVVVVITVTDGSAEQSAEIANAVAREFATIAPTLEPPGPDNRAVVRITVVNSATVPTAPASPVLRFNVALGLLLGLALGLVLAITREALDGRVKDRRDLAATTDAPVLVSVPPDPTLRAWSERGTGEGGPDVEALRQLRAILQASDLLQSRPSVVVTSTLAGEGKTTVATGLAWAFAEAGQRVCLLEADLRDPSIAGLLGVEVSPGLSEVLTGSVDWQQAMHTLGDQRPLDVLVAGGGNANPTQLLAGDAAGTLIRELEKHYDVVVVDSPPLLSVADPSILVSACGGAVVVVGWGHRAVTQTELEDGLARIAAVQGELIGLVTNRFPQRGADPARSSEPRGRRPAR